MKGALVEPLDSDGHTALHLAVEGGHTDVVELLLMKGASNESSDTLILQTPLHLAAKNGHIGLVELCYGATLAIEV